MRLMTKATGSDRKVQEITIFHDVAKALTSSLDLDSILQTIMEKMAEYFRPDTWSLLMVDEEKDELYFAIAVGTASGTDYYRRLHRALQRAPSASDIRNRGVPLLTLRLRVHGTVHRSGPLQAGE